MPISFNNIPANWKIPLYWAEFDPSKAGLPVFKQAALLVGTKLAAGSAPPDVQIPIGSQAQADAAFGAGSELALAFRAFFANNFAQEVWGGPVAEPSGGTAASGTVTVSAPPTDAGDVHLYISGHHVMVSVGASDTANSVAAAIASAINANTDPVLPVTAAAVAAVVTLTSRWKGITGNDIDMRANYFGTVGGEALPPGLVLTFSGSGKLSGGAGVPTFSNLISALGEQEFEYVSLPYTDSTSLLAWETEYNFGDEGRWGWMRQLYGHLFSAKRGLYSDLLTFGPTRNSAQLSILGIEVGMPSPVYEVAAAYTAKAARALTNDPARPLQTLQLQGILPAPRHQRFLLDELNALATTGIATQRTLSDNVPMIARETTTYQLNLYGQTDDAYELVTTLATLARLIRNQRQAITLKFPRSKLADDGTPFGQGQAIVTPKTIKAELVAQYAIDEFNGLTENMTAFKANLIVERDSNNPNRVNVLYPPDLVNQLRIFAVLAQFRLQYDRGLDTAIL
jgi:phage tail sheath gpL-like